MKIVPRYVMFDYLVVAYQDSDYTIMITVMHWPRCILLVLKLTLVLKYFGLPVGQATTLTTLPPGWGSACITKRQCMMVIMAV